MTSEDWHIVGFTALMAALSTLALFGPGLALACWLARRRSWTRTVVETLVTVPLVLPPVVTGLVLLQLFGRRGPLGSWLYGQFGIEIVFTWRAVVLALAVMSLPLFILVVRAAIEDVNPSLEQMARTLGAGRWRVFFTITMPLARRGILAGTLLAFARALGEFGATILVAGNIPGKTTTLAVSVYQHIQTGNDRHAWLLAGLSLALAIGAIATTEWLQRRHK